VCARNIFYWGILKIHGGLRRILVSRERTHFENSAEVLIIKFLKEHKAKREKAVDKIHEFVDIEEFQQ